MTRTGVILLPAYYPHDTPEVVTILIFILLKRNLSHRFK